MISEASNASADVGKNVEKSSATILGVVEFRPSPSEDWQVNIRRIRNVASRSAIEGCDLLVFPEYSLGSGVQDLSSVSRELSDISRDHGLYLVVTSLVRVDDDDSPDKGLVFNMALAFNPRGELAVS